MSMQHTNKGVGLNIFITIHEINIEVTYCLSGKQSLCCPSILCPGRTQSVFFVRWNVVAWPRLHAAGVWSAIKYNILQNKFV